MPNKKEEEDGDAMQLAFQQFMMSQSTKDTVNITSTNTTPSVKKKKKKHKSKTIQHPTSPLPQSNTIQTHKTQQQLQRLELQLKRSSKKYYQIYQNFHYKLQSQWLALDDDLEQVVQSIASIRHRLPMESRLLLKQCSKGNNDDSDGKLLLSERKEWTRFGYRQNGLSGEEEDETQDDYPWFPHQYDNETDASSLWITREDIQLAASHDMLQHEKMMGGLRCLFSNLSDCHEAMSRILDEGMKHDYDVSVEMAQYEELFYGNLNKDELGDELESEEQPSILISLGKVMKFITTMSTVFEMLSLELYRKQIMAQQIFSSVQDALILGDNGSTNSAKLNVGSSSAHNDVWDNLSPSQIADRCSKHWSRDSKLSHVDVSMLNKMLKTEEDEDGY